MIYFYDLHIHSVLSSDADELMTPNNIFNMAYLKKLDLIAVTDHNSLKNIKACHELSQSYDFLFIPGVEIAVKEGCHVLCYFKHLDEALQFDKLLEKHIQKTTYDSEVIGIQEVMDVNDEIIEVIPYHLNQTLDLSILDIKAMLKPFDYILCYAHIDRTKHGALDYIEKIPLDAIELTDRSNPNNYLAFKTMKNSDAHTITHLLERTKDNQIELNDLTIDDFFEVFKNHG